MAHSKKKIENQPSNIKNPSGEAVMDLKQDEGLKTLLESGKEKGFLTYSQVNEYLPDDAVNPEKLDQLLMVLEEQGIELIDESEAEEREAGPAPGQAASDPEIELRDLDLNFVEEEGDGRRIDDPVRMYLTQMGEIPLLSRNEEISLAKKIEVTRKRFRRKVLECDYALCNVVDTLKRVGILLLPSNWRNPKLRDDKHIHRFNALRPQIQCVMPPCYVLIRGDARWCVAVATGTRS